MWSLAVEEQFYIVFPLVCFAARRSIVRHPVRAAVVALCRGGRVDGVDGGARVTDRRSVARVSRHRLARDGSARRRGARCARGHGRTVGGDGGPLAIEPGRSRAAPSRSRSVSLIAILVVMRVASDHTYALYRGGFLVFALLCGAIVVVVVTLPGAEIAKMLPRAVAGRGRVALVLALFVALAGSRVRVAAFRPRRRGAVRRPAGRSRWCSPRSRTA